MELVKSVVVGMDVGQQQDPTAIAVTISPMPGLNQITAKSLERLPLGTGYPEVRDRVLNILHNIEIAFFAELPGRYVVEVRVDATGVGRPVVDMLREIAPSARIYGITLTAGHEQSRKGWDWYVPKQHLVNTLTRYMAERRLLLPATEEARQFQRELRAFQGRKESAQHIETGARHGAHDDLVIAVGLALLPSRPGAHRPPRQRQALVTADTLGRSRRRHNGLSPQQQQIQAYLDRLTPEERADEWHDNMRVARIRPRSDVRPGQLPEELR